ncbi:MAG: hypothetical protein Q5536_06945, partial [Haemophilus parahaemolyticus]|nr:hypothetical protein [Haemophilus parahaemolyticus]
SQAAEKKAAEKQAPQQTQKRDIALERFNQNVGIYLISRGLQTDQNNQPMVTLTYTLQNKGKNKIKSLHWVSAYQIENNTFYVRELPINFEPSLNSKQQIDVTFNVPLSEMPEQAQQLFANREAKISVINGAKNVVFSNGKRIVVAK